VVYRADDAAAELRSNLAPAYPQQANLERWNRSIKLDRARNEIELNDDYALKSAAKAITLTLMTPCKVTQQGPGKLRLEGALQIAYDPALTPSIEEIKLEDGQLRNAWGERLYRILLKAENPSLRGKWITRLLQSE
jgi:hypothetical protein